MIKRTPTRAEGGITEAEKAALAAHTEKWIGRVMRTDPIDPSKIIPAIEQLYATAGLSKPRVIVVPSPLVANIAGGLSAALLHLRKQGAAATEEATYQATDQATRQATDQATRQATYQATRQATYQATEEATRQATYQATYQATRQATYQATEEAENSWLLDLVKKYTPNAVSFSLDCIRKAWRLRQGGNHWGSWDCYLSATRDVLGLTGLAGWEKYTAWEECAIEGSWRIMHADFCMVSDFPEILRKDEENRPHSEIGPSHRWRDGWELYHLDGIKLEKERWQKIVRKQMSFGEIMGIENADIRALALKYNPDSIINENAKLIDKSRRGNELFLIEGTDLNAFLEEPAIWFLRMKCPTGRVFVEGVDPSFARRNPKADLCQANALGLTPTQYRNLAIEG
jgi:hypothetical protein